MRLYVYICMDVYILYVHDYISRYVYIYSLCIYIYIYTTNNRTNYIYLTVYLTGVS